MGSSSTPAGHPTGRKRAGRPGGRLSTLQKAAVANLLRVSPVSDELGARFAAAGHELHLVGGSVRDALLSRLGDDLDFTTDARPAQVLALVDVWADGTWGTGIDFGTVGVLKSGLRLEITTFRSDLYDGNTRNPIVTFGDSLAGILPSTSREVLARARERSRCTKERVRHRVWRVR